MAEPIIQIIWTKDDVLAIAEDLRDEGHVITDEQALERAYDWGRHIAETASSLCAEQLVSVIRTGNP